MGENPDAVAPSANNLDASQDHMHKPIDTSLDNQAPPPEQQHAGHQRRPQHHSGGQHPFSSQLDMSTPSSHNRGGPYNMGPMANTLPPSSHQPVNYIGGQQYHINSTASPPMMAHIQPTNQYNAQGPMPHPSHGYYVPQQHMHQYYGAQMSPNQGHANMPPRSGIPYYNQMVLNHPQQPYYYSHSNHYSGHPQSPTPNTTSGHYMVGSPTSGTSHGLMQDLGNAGVPAAASKYERRQSVARGPPRKPRQSGHAIWIGNLPPQADLMSLVHHVCKEAPGLESLFLISKSNCAFANFKTEATCATAQQKLHDSKFQSVRLVSRLRKSTVEGSQGITAPTGPASAGANLPVPSDKAPSNSPSDNSSAGSSIGVSAPTTTPAAEGGTSRQDKFFILKSLTMEDLERSVRTGIWATQSHNDESLSVAFKSSDNVYLVFSANKSGEYFGYARMVSQIDNDPDAAIEFAPKAIASTEVDLPHAIPTKETDHAPKGRIIDDSARGTIFWEAERDDDSDHGSDSGSETQSNKSEPAEDGGEKTWGKPFKLEWLSTTRLPFYRTRGLRNPWNSNREVKIARDGTELEPSVGRRLIGLFNRVQSPGPVHAAIRGPMPMMPGYAMGPYGQ